MSGRLFQRAREQRPIFATQPRCETCNRVRRLRRPIGGHASRRLLPGPGAVENLGDLLADPPEPVPSGGGEEAGAVRGGEQAQGAVHQQPAPGHLAAGGRVAGAVPERGRRVSERLEVPVKLPVGDEDEQQRSVGFRVPREALGRTDELGPDAFPSELGERPPGQAFPATLHLPVLLDQAAALARRQHVRVAGALQPDAERPPAVLAKQPPHLPEGVLVLEVQTGPGLDPAAVAGRHGEAEARLRQPEQTGDRADGRGGTGGVGGRSGRGKVVVHGSR